MQFARNGRAMRYLSGFFDFSIGISDSPRDGRPWWSDVTSNHNSNTQLKLGEQKFSEAGPWAWSTTIKIMIRSYDLLSFSQKEVVASRVTSLID